MGEPDLSRRFDLLITDLDNTIYDWERFFIPAFLAMLTEVERISGIDRPTLQASFRRVYQRHGTSEYAFVLQEADVLRHIDADLSPAEVFEKYDTAIHAFRSVRKRALQLFPGVQETLMALKTAGVRIVAHSDSPLGYVSRRLRQLDVDELFDAICAPRDHGVPPELESIVRQAPESTVAARTRLLEYDAAIRKPNPDTLTPVFEAFPIRRERAVYVGDNLSRDMLLAQRAGLKGAWARYGTLHEPALRQELYKITYWTDADVSNEARLRKETESAAPTYVLDSFADLINVLDVSRYPEANPDTRRPIHDDI